MYIVTVEFTDKIERVTLSCHAKPTIGDSSVTLHSRGDELMIPMHRISHVWCRHEKDEK